MLSHEIWNEGNNNDEKIKQTDERNESGKTVHGSSPGLRYQQIMVEKTCEKVGFEPRVKKRSYC